VHFGLTFMAIAAAGKSHTRWSEEDRARRQRMDRHQRLSWAEPDQLEPEERAILDEIDEQLKSETPRTSQRRCPECQRPLVLIEVASLQIESCPHCRGIWFDPGELTELAGLSGELPEPDKTTRPARHRCPDCQEQMTEYALFHPLNLLVDRCSQGHGVYLEDRELERVFEIR